jgi:DNA-binding response OmpR family regulator
MVDRQPVILVVDDDVDIVETLRLVLERHGYVVVSANTAGQALRRADEHQPELIIADLMMEEVDSGIRLVTRLRARGCQAPVFMLSSVGDALHGSVDASSVGLAGIFQKPVEPAALVATLASHLDGRG